MPLPGIDEPDTTPPAPAPPPRADSGECSPERRQDVVRECELSCSKSLEISTCLFDRRKCMIEARYSQQRQRDQELCDLSWERCIFKSGIGPGSWDRCVDGCRKKNELSLCPPSGEGAP